MAETKKIAARSHALQELRIENQLQFAWRTRLCLLTPVLQELVIEDQRKLARPGGVCRGWSPGSCERADRAFPVAHMPQNPFDHICLATFDEADDLHPAAAVRALQGIDLVHPPHEIIAYLRPSMRQLNISRGPLDEHRPGGLRAVGIGPLGFDGGTVEAWVFVRGGQARVPAIIVRVGVLGLFVARKR